MRPLGIGRASLAGLVGLYASAACTTDVNGAGTASRGVCGTPVEDVDLRQCSSCSPPTACTSAAPLDACCAWVAEPPAPLAVATGLHRFSEPAQSSGQNDAAPPPSSTACLSAPGTLGKAQDVTLTGYVGLYSTGQDSAGVQVDVFTENDPNVDGSIAGMPIGTYTTGASDPIDPTDSTWNSKCDDGCSYRQYTIQNVPTETPLVIRTSDAGSTQWATLYEYNVYFASSAVSGGVVSYDATAFAIQDLTTVAGEVGQTLRSDSGLLVGEVHDCNDVRLAGATVGTDASNSSDPIETFPVFYLTSDESSPLPTLDQAGTSVLGGYQLVNVPSGTPVRVSAAGADPTNAGQYLMLGTYTVQAYPGAVTALTLRGRRPWQP